NIAILFSDIAGAQLIDPDRLHDAKHPTVKPRPLLELVLPRQRPFTRRLHQIVGLGGRSGEAAGKAAQPRQDRNHLLAELRAPRVPAPRGPSRGLCLLPTERQRASSLIYSRRCWSRTGGASRSSRPHACRKMGGTPC